VTDPTPAPETHLPQRTTPTWDMELLVSAASVFTLVQMPGWLDEAYFALRPRLDMDWDALIRLLYIYGKLGVLVLAGAFTLHLLMRAHWIALVGMHSIFPDGVHLDKLDIGPRRRDFLLARATTATDRIERADNRSSIVFAVGLTMAAVQLGLLVLVGGAYVVSVGLARAFGWTWLLPNGAFLIVALLSAPYLVAAAVDRARGARIVAGSRTARAIDATYEAYARVGMGLEGGSILEMLQSRLGTRKVMGWALGGIALCGLIAASQVLLQRGRVELGAYAQWPDAEAGHTDSLLPAHYRDQALAEPSLLPTIDSAFPEGEYLTLVVPFDPRRVPPEMAKHCPGPWGDDASPARRAALLECLSRWLALRVDGKPIPSPRVRYTIDAKSGQHAMLTVVSIAALAPGEHEIALRRAPSTEKRKDTNRAPDYLIAFWK
jgi:hypothetical protein